MSIDISGFTYKYIALAIIWFFCILLPGYLFLFIFRGDFYYYLNFFSLTMLALTITHPVLLYNTLMLLLVYKDFDADSKVINSFFKGEIFTTLVFYFSIIIGFLFDMKMTHGVMIVLMVEVLISIYFLYRIYRNHVAGLQKK